MLSVGGTIRDIARGPAATVPAVRAYKFLDADGCTVFTGTRWALPFGGEPGPWIEGGPVRPCHSGIHACLLDDLAYWIADELWEIELDGDVERAHHKVAARRGRLVRRIGGWAGGVATEFPHWCAWRTRDRAVEVLQGSGETAWADRVAAANTLADVQRLARDAAAALGDESEAGMLASFAGDAADLAGRLAISAFVAACAAGHTNRRQHDDEASYAAGFAAERAAQSAWIATQLQLV